MAVTFTGDACSLIVNEEGVTIIVHATHANTEGAESLHLPIPAAIEFTDQWRMFQGAVAHSQQMDAARAFLIIADREDPAGE